MKFYFRVLVSVCVVLLWCVPSHAFDRALAIDSSLEFEIGYEALSQAFEFENRQGHLLDRRQLNGLELGGELSFTLVPQHTDRTLIGTRSVSGRLVDSVGGHDAGWFVIGIASDGIEGALWTDRGVWVVRGGRPTNQGRTPVRFILSPDHDGRCSGSTVPDFSEFEIVPKFMPAEESVISLGESDTPDQIRVLVVYDDVVDSSIGSLAAYVTAMVGSANFAYLNSGADPLFLVVAGIERIESPVTNNDGLILRQLTDRYDLISDEVHTLRDAYDADLVAQLVDIPGFCGRAWLSPDDARYGFFGE